MEDNDAKESYTDLTDWFFIINVSFIYRASYRNKKTTAKLQVQGLQQIKSFLIYGAKNYIYKKDKKYRYLERISIYFN